MCAATHGERFSGIAYWSICLWQCRPHSTSESISVTRLLSFGVVCAHRRIRVVAILKARPYTEHLEMSRRPASSHMVRVSLGRSNEPLETAAERIYKYPSLKFGCQHLSHGSPLHRSRPRHCNGPIYYTVWIWRCVPFPACWRPFEDQKWCYKVSFSQSC